MNRTPAITKSCSEHDEPFRSMCCHRPDPVCQAGGALPSKQLIPAGRPRLRLVLTMIRAAELQPAARSKPQNPLQRVVVEPCDTGRIRAPVPPPSCRYAAVLRLSGARPGLGTLLAEVHTEQHRQQHKSKAPGDRRCPVPSIIYSTRPPGRLTVPSAAVSRNVGRRPSAHRRAICSYGSIHRFRPP